MLGIRNDVDTYKMERRIRRHVGVVEKVRAGFHGNVTGAKPLRGPGARWWVVPGTGRLKAGPPEQPGGGGCMA